MPTSGYSWGTRACVGDVSSLRRLAPERQGGDPGEIE